MPGFTVYFATDLHGSEQCFRKFLNAGKFYGADAVILGGDVAGKALIPVVSGPGGSFEAHAYGQSYRAEGEDGPASLEARIRGLGCYPYRTTPDQLIQMRNDPEQLDRAFEQVISETLERWISMAEDRLRAAGLPCLVMPGNDDPPWVRRLLDQAEWLQQAEERIAVRALPGAEPRLFDADAVGLAPGDHRGPYARQAEHPGRAAGSRPAGDLQLAQPAVRDRDRPRLKLDGDLRIKTAGGEPLQEPVGSHAIRESIEEVQPVVALCGHIHESRATSKLGRTVVVNPGSQYPGGSCRARS